MARPIRAPDKERDGRRQRYVVEQRSKTWVSGTVAAAIEAAESLLLNEE
jgi:hypothetical protein